MKTRNHTFLLLFCIIILGFISEPSGASKKRIQKHLDYYRSIQEQIAGGKKIDFDSIDFRRLRFSVLLNSLMMGRVFLREENIELEKCIEKGAEAEALQIAKVIIEDEITNPVALAVLAESKSVNKSDLKLYKEMSKRVSASILSSGDGKNFTTAYEILANGEIGFVMKRKGPDAAITQMEEHKGRKYLVFMYDDSQNDDSKIYFDVTASRTRKLAKRKASFEKNFREEEKFMDTMLATSRIEHTEPLRPEIIAAADSMADHFIMLYRNMKWDELWEHYKEKSEYHTPRGYR